MEEFVKYEDIGEPDSRNLIFCVVNSRTHESRPLTLSDVYKAIEKIKLHKRVPDQIASQFNIAKNLAVYSWHCYPFHQISELKAYSTLEAALRTVIEIKNPTLRKLIKKATTTGLINDSCFQHLDPRNQSVDFCQKLDQRISRFRNDLAHGDNTLHPNSALTLSICADFINQLFMGAADD